ncbi:MAG: hydroxymethylbilane synthase [Planctomycetes bacterium]|nr:hydroxymethylbilane synthase [Planctomycetota bacterium]
MKLRLGTRGSALATSQSKRILRRLEALGHEIEMVIIKTEGDKDQVRPFVELGPAGLFVRSLEQALVENRIDFAVHSYKDLPSLSPESLIVACMPERMSQCDRLLISKDAHDPDAPGALPLRQGSVVGTASARRMALLHDLRPDLKSALLRGNVPTRVQKLRDGNFDAILLATAGLERLDEAVEIGDAEALDRSGLIEIDLDMEAFIPAPSQGALALQTRKDDTAVREALMALDDAKEHRAVALERRLLALVDAGCQVPFGAWCKADPESDELSMVAFLERNGVRNRAEVYGFDIEDLAQQALGMLLAGESSK